MSEGRSEELGGPVERWETLSRKTIVETPIFSIAAKQCRHPKRGIEGEFYCVESNDWVNVLPITEDRHVVLVNQFRFGIDETSWEIPGGVMEDGEDPISTASRELQEETGFASRNFRLLGSVRPNPAIQSNSCHLIVAENCLQTVKIDWDEHEELEIKLIPIDGIYEMAFSGEIVHSLVLNALFLYYPEWERLQRRRRS